MRVEREGENARISYGSGTHESGDGPFDITDFNITDSDITNLI